MATTYRVSFDVVIADADGNPRKWIPAAVSASLEDGEEAFNWEFEEIDSEDYDGQPDEAEAGEWESFDPEFEELDSEDYDGQPDEAQEWESFDPDC